VQLIDGRIADLRFSGEACAIAIASASMLGDLVAERDATFVRQLRERYVEWLRNADATASDAFGELNALAELKRYPSRHACALLSFATLEAALRGDAHASSQSNPPESVAL
jgi:nitrogen fixation NifU-like protein